MRYMMETMGPGITDEIQLVANSGTAESRALSLLNKQIK